MFDPSEAIAAAAVSGILIGLILGMMIRAVRHEQERTTLNDDLERDRIRLERSRSQS